MRPLCDGVVDTDPPPVYFKPIAVFLGLAVGKKRKGEGGGGVEKSDSFLEEEEQERQG